MRIDWSQTTLSNHQKIALVKLVEDIPVDPSFDHVLPLEGGCQTIRISRNGASEGFDAQATETHLGDPRKACAIDYGVEHTIGLDYHYRNAGGAEVSGFCVFSGSLSWHDHAILLTALAGAEMGCFIPSQVGLDDLQSSVEWELDFENHDHVWHTFECLIRTPRSATVSIQPLLAACRDQITRPWDDDLAMRQHLGAI